MNIGDEMYIETIFRKRGGFMDRIRLFAGQEGKDELVKCLEVRLRWQSLEAAEEEFDLDEVMAVVNLLKVLDPIKEPEFFNAEKALERFWKYYRQRVEEGIQIDAGEDKPNTEQNKGTLIGCG